MSLAATLCSSLLTSFPYSYPTLTQGHSLSFPPSLFIFALFPDCLGTRQVVDRFGVLLTRGNLAAVSPFSAPVRSDPFTGWVPPNLLGAPLPFLGFLLGGQVFVYSFPFWFPLAAPKYRFTPILVFRELVFSSFPTPFGSSFRPAVLAVPRSPFPFLGVSPLTLGVYFLVPALRLSTRFG